MPPRPSSWLSPCAVRRAHLPCPLSRPPLLRNAARNLHVSDPSRSSHSLAWSSPSAASSSATRSSSTSRNKRIVAARKSPDIKRLVELLDNPGIHLNGLIDALLSIPIQHLSPNHLIRSFERESDPQSLLQISPAVLEIVEGVHLQTATILLEKLLEHYGRHRMLAAAPPLIDVFLARADQEWEGTIYNESHFDLLKASYKKMLDACAFFASDNYKLEPIRRVSLPPHIHIQVYKLVQDLIHRLEELPGSSSYLDDYAQMGIRMRKMLFSRRYITPDLRNLVLGHVRRCGGDLSPGEWHRCALSAVKEGDQNLAEMFMAEKMRVLEMRLAEGDGDFVEDRKIEGMEPGSLATISRAEDLERSLRTQFDQDDHAEIDRVILASSSRNLTRATTELEPFLLNQTMPDTSHQSLASASTPAPLKADLAARTAAYAWSSFFHKLSRQLDIPAEDVISLHQALPPEIFVAETVTPVIHALHLRGAHHAAWDIWLDLVSLQSDAAATPDLRPMKWIDRVVLSVATNVCFELQGLSAAVELVDSWAARLTSHQVGTSDTAKTVVLDAQNVNVLLHLCRKSGSPSTAFRLWAAAYPRWGVRLDDISLTLLLDTARFVPLEEDSVGSRLRALADQFKRSKVSTSADDDLFEEYDAQGFSGGSTSVLLDPPGYAWSSQYGSTTPWQRAKSIFEDVVFGNWPHLKDTTSPLELSGGFAATAIWPSVPSEVSFIPPSLPSPHAKYTHIIPSATTLHSYVSLLGFYEHAKDIPVVFAWAKEMGIKPKWETMRTALLAIGEVEGPRRWIKNWGENGETKLVRDEEIMRRWLRVWLDDDPSVEHGESSNVPTEQDVADLIRANVEKQQSLNA